MSNITPVSPRHINLESRRREVASLLALGLVRLRGGYSTEIAAESEFELGFLAEQRVHTKREPHATEPL